MTAGMLMQRIQGRAEPPVPRHDARMPHRIPPCFKVTIAVLYEHTEQELIC